MKTSRHVGHSADVKMCLTIDGLTLSVGQLGPDFLFLDTPLDHPPTVARLFLSVDGNEHEWTVNLPEGISAASRRVALAKAE